MSKAVSSSAPLVVWRCLEDLCFFGIASSYEWWKMRDTSTEKHQTCGIFNYMHFVWDAPQYQWQMKGLEGSISKNVTILIVICIPGGGKVSIPNFTVIIYINIINLQPSNKGKIIENYNYNYKLPFKVTLARITIIWVAQFTEHHLQAGVFMHIAMPKIVAKQLEIPSIDLSKEPIEQHQQVGWTCSLYVFL